MGGSGDSRGGEHLKLGYVLKAEPMESTDLGYDREKRDQG